MSQDIKFEKFMREGKAIENAVMEILKKDFAEAFERLNHFFE